MAVTIAVADSNATLEYKDLGPGATLLDPAWDVGGTFGVGVQPWWLRAFGMEEGDEITIQMVGGTAREPLYAPFRPTAPVEGDPPIDTKLTFARNYIVLYFPGRYRLVRTSGATGVTVYGFPGSSTHEASDYYATVTGESVVNTIEAGTVSPAFDLEFDPMSGEVVANLELNIDPGADNLVTEEAGGISVIAVDTVSALDTATIDMTVTQVDPNIAVVSGDVRISATAGNVITAVADGLFANPVTSVAVTDTATLDLTLGGTAQAPSLSGSVILSPTTGNILTSPGNGVYASRQPEQTLVSNTYTFGDTDSQTLSFVTALRDSLGASLPIGYLTVPADASLTQTYAEVSLEFYAGAYTSSNPGAINVAVAYTTDFVGDLIFQSLIKVDGYSAVLGAEPFHMQTISFRQKFINAQTLYIQVTSADVGVTNFFCIASVRVIGP